MKILLDAGHGVTTPGKRSVDGELREYKYCREILQDVKSILENEHGIEVIPIVTDDSDVSLTKRVRIANQHSDCILISIHCNAAGDGSKWINASGWSVFVSNNASSNSKRLAECLCDAAVDQSLKIRIPTKDQKYWTQDLAICRDTKCPAVLTENMFMDSIKDKEFLLSSEGRKAIVDLHVNGILKYLNK